MARLDKTFSTNDCAMCLLGPRMGAAERHPDIQLLTLSELTDLEGELGHFTANVVQAPRRVDEDLYTACGNCWNKCPARLDNSFDLGQGKRRSAGLFFPQSVPAVPHINPATCLYLRRRATAGCARECADPAPSDWTKRSGKCGWRWGRWCWPPVSTCSRLRRGGNYGHGVYRNLLTSMELKRLLSSSGPTGGEVRRPADGRTLVCWFAVAAPTSPRWWMYLAWRLLPRACRGWWNRLRLPMPVPRAPLPSCRKWCGRRI